MREDMEAPLGQRPSARRGLGVAMAIAVSVGVVAAGALQLVHGDGEGIGLAAALVRFARYLTTTLAVGGVIFLTIVRPPALPVAPAARRITMVVAGVSGVVAALGVPSQAAYLAARPSAVVDPSAIAGVLGSGFGQSAALGVVGAVALLFAARSAPAPLSGALGAPAVLVALGAFLLTGHTATSEPRLLVLGANLVHTAAAAVWLGGLVLLPVALRERRRADDLAGAARLLAGFSTAATWAIVAVAVAGGALTWVEVRAVEAMATPYGLVLGGKVGVVAFVAALGTYNNRRLVPQLTSPGTEPEGWDRLRVIVRLEAALLVVALALTAVLVNVTPARVDAEIDQATEGPGIAVDTTVERFVETRAGSPQGSQPGMR
ncbi:hypothetical protein ER308_16760 [Egibacter rhizosphaerae]|uniref:Copper resistance protein D domain-containing protein n=1 Tax=Egibacter rhizosphaerae TaxID=1670831 RepID=A0A411YIT4_9ACTN|nr:CopD family protein [Egibacter rhizosphaerae]QBI21061.1 hypothetical protein ER308_16760 [Egibacter rhizosphaerae]